jgi:hypothetical protein
MVVFTIDVGLTPCLKRGGTGRCDVIVIVVEVIMLAGMALALALATRPCN